MRAPPSLRHILLASSQIQRIHACALPGAQHFLTANGIKNAPAVGLWRRPDDMVREIAPLVLTGPPSVTGFAGGRPRVQEIMAYWPALIRREAVESELRVEVRDV